MKKFILRYLGTGFLLIVVFNVVLLLLSLLFGFEDSSKGPTFPTAMIFALVMMLAVFVLVNKLKPTSLKEALTYSISWTSIVLIVILVTTIANDTTSIFFGSWFNYLVFLTMAFSPALIRLLKKGR